MIRAELPLIQQWMTGIPGPILDVGSSSLAFRQREQLPYNLAGLLQAEIVSFDSKAEPGVDIVGDAEQLCAFLVGRRFHGIICTSLLEHVRRPWRVVRQCYRAMLGGGRIFVSALWVYQDHPDPIDCYRFSPLGLRSLCVDAGFRCLVDGERPEGRNRISYFVGEKSCSISFMG